MAQRIDDEHLHRYFDGELSLEEADAVRRALEGDSEAQAKVAGLEHHQRLLKVAAEDLGASLDSEALFAAIQERIAGGSDQEVTHSAHPNLQVLDGGSMRPPVERWKVAIPVAVAFAAAAAVFLSVALRKEPASDSVATNAQEPAPVEAMAPDETTTVVEPMPGSEVLEVDFGDNAGTVFAVEGSSGEPLAVVWIEDAMNDKDEL
ncbi:MAG: zf-HC2 domain-containing protein [Myxococcales bacterium]|nr:zf-HC2 domain-containing protein [Myxococcales bacterium]